MSSDPIVFDSLVKRRREERLLSVQDLYCRVRESHIMPGSYRLQRLLGASYHHTLSFAPLILVSGTNGKGSTCAFLESIFRYSKFKTGLYTSPHLVHVTERIRIAGVPILEKELLDTIEKLDTNRKHFLPNATFFELMTAASLLLFYEKKVDVIICEVGLGGRYDSTNALNPMISVLTSVSLDHTKILGKNVNTIAEDKSYIARRNKPFVVNHNISKEALGAVIKTTNRIGSKMILTSKNLNASLEKIFSEFSKHKNAVNLRTALTVVDCLQKDLHEWCISKLMPNFNDISVRTGIQNTFWPGRFDVRKIKNRIFIFDCAHNPGGIKFFIELYLKSEFFKKKFNLIFASLKDKDWKQNISLLAPMAQCIEITQIKNERSQNAKSIFLYLKRNFPQMDINISNHLKISIDRAMDRFSTNPILVIGSIAFIGSVFESLNINVFPK